MNCMTMFSSYEFCVILGNDNVELLNCRACSMIFRTMSILTLEKYSLKNLRLFTQVHKISQMIIL